MHESKFIQERFDEDGLRFGCNSRCHNLKIRLMQPGRKHTDNDLNSLCIIFNFDKEKINN